MKKTIKNSNELRLIPLYLILIAGFVWNNLSSYGASKLGGCFLIFQKIIDQVKIKNPSKRDQIIYSRRIYTEEVEKEFQILRENPANGALSENELIKLARSRVRSKLDSKALKIAFDQAVYDIDAAGGHQAAVNRLNSIVPLKKYVRMMPAERKKLPWSERSRLDKLQNKLDRTSLIDLTPSEAKKYQEVFDSILQMAAYQIRKGDWQSALVTLEKFDDEAIAGSGFRYDRSFGIRFGPKDFSSPDRILESFEDIGRKASVERTEAGLSARISIPMILYKSGKEPGIDIASVRGVPGSELIELQKMAVLTNMEELIHATQRLKKQGGESVFVSSTMQENESRNYILSRSSRLYPNAINCDSSGTEADAHARIIELIGFENVPEYESRSDRYRTLPIVRKVLNERHLQQSFSNSNGSHHP